MNISNTIIDAASFIQQQPGYVGVFYYIIFLAVWVFLCLPCSVVEIIPGYLFGFNKGVIASLLGKSLGSFFSFVCGRYIFRNFIQRNIFPRFPVIRALGKAVEKEGFKMIVFIRVTYLPMIVKNWGLAVLDVSIFQSLLAGFLTGIPFSMMWSLIGSQSHNIGEIVNGKKSLSDVLSTIIPALGLVDPNDSPEKVREVTEKMIPFGVAFLSISGYLAYLLFQSFQRSFRLALSEHEKTS